jgi:hypothetical protein
LKINFSSEHLAPDNVRMYQRLILLFVYLSFVIIESLEAQREQELEGL